MMIRKTYDRKDYTPDMTLFEKNSVRAIIRKNGRVAAQKGAKGDHKLLGGGMDPGETPEDALQREVREESGLLVRPETIEPVGEVLEKRRDLFEADKIFCIRSRFYVCKIKEETVPPQMTESEIAKGYHLVWVTPEEFIEANRPFYDEPWIRRDSEFLEAFAKE